MKKNNIIYVTAGLAMVASMLPVLTVFAETGKPEQNDQRQNFPRMMQGKLDQERGKMPGNFKPGIVGTVSAVNGNSITVTSRKGFATSTAAVTYTIDASSAVVFKNNATSTVSSITVGDMISAQGTVSGTNVVATTIRDGNFGIGKRGPGEQNGKTRNASSTPQFVGNGQPIILGTISAISGNTLTVTNPNNVTYTVDASNAKILQGQKTVAVTNLAVGNNVVIQGTVNGTSVVASSVIEKQQNNKPSDDGENSNNGGQKPGFFKGVKNFFTHLFGF